MITISIITSSYFIPALKNVNSSANKGTFIHSSLYGNVQRMMRQWKQKGLMCPKPFGGWGNLKMGYSVMECRGLKEPIVPEMDSAHSDFNKDKSLLVGESQKTHKRSLLISGSFPHALSL